MATNPVTNGENADEAIRLLAPTSPAEGSADPVVLNRGAGRGRGGGPKTPAGKDKSSQNAVQHAITSPNPVAGGESLAEWEAFHEGFRQAYRPVGVVEEELVYNMATYKWRARRVIRAEAAAINLTYGAVDDQVETAHGRKGPSPVERQLAKYGMSLGGCCELLESLASRAGTAELTDPDWKGLVIMLEGLVGPLPSGIEQALPTAPWTAEAFRKFLKHVAVSMGATYDSLVDGALSKAHRLLEEASVRNAADAQRRSVLTGNAILPKLDVQEKFIRYEAHLEKLFAKALAQLEVQQRLRAGQDVERPIRFQVTEG
jgi:hypothetical protein